MTTAKTPSKTPQGGRSAAQLWAEGDAEARRRLIVDLALDILREQGLAAVTMRSVAARVGVGTMTLYTYVEGQHGLHRGMVQRGFEMLHCNCRSNSTAENPARDTPESRWIGGARAYIQFAVENPGLYKLMFDHPMTPHDHDLMEGGFKPLLDKVTNRLAEQGRGPGDDLPAEARRCAGRFWITLHGVAMLAIAGRLCVLEGGIDELLQDLLPRVAPA